MDSRFEQLTLRLAKKPPADAISDVEIQAEVDAVRRACGSTQILSHAWLTRVDVLLQEGTRLPEASKGLCEETSHER